MQHELREITSQNNPSMDMMRNHMEKRTTLLLSMKAAVFEPALLEELREFLTSTVFWLVQVNMVNYFTFILYLNVL